MQKSLMNRNNNDEEQWFNILHHSIYVSATLATLVFWGSFYFFSSCDIYERIRCKLFKKESFRKAEITVGQISNIHSTKKVLTLRDYTDYYIFFVLQRS